MKESTVRKVQTLFKHYRENKQQLTQTAITQSPYSPLLTALDLRFQCMRAVAAAKFPIQKPITDETQTICVLNSIREFALEHEIKNLNAVEMLFTR